MNMTRRYPAGALESQTMAIKMYKCASGRSNCLIDGHAGNASKSLEPVIDTMRKLVHVGPCYALKPLDALEEKNSDWSHRKIEKAKLVLVISSGSATPKGQLAALRGSSQLAISPLNDCFEPYHCSRFGSRLRKQNAMHYYFLVAGSGAYDQLGE
jgi:hypothetical protein